MDQYFAYKNRLFDLDLNVILEGLSSSPLSLGQYFDNILIKILWANLRYANWYLIVGEPKSRIVQKHIFLHPKGIRLEFCILIV